MTTKSNLINNKSSNNTSKITMKEYYHIKDLHNEIIEDMDEYFEKDKYNLKQVLKNIGPYLLEELNCDEEKLKVYFDFDNDNIDIFYEVFYYNNHSHMTSITEEYIKNEKYKENKEKAKMLEAMNNSYASLFEIIDINESHIELKDVFNNEKVKIIDTTLNVLKNVSNTIYIYSRIITYDNISFIACTPIIIKKEKEEIKKYIKSNKDKMKSSLTTTLELYQIEKV